MCVCARTRALTRYARTQTGLTRTQKALRDQIQQSEDRQLRMAQENAVAVERFEAAALESLRFASVL